MHNTQLRKYFLLLPILVNLVSFKITIAQQFELVNGPLSTKLSDSRSINIIDLNQDGWEDVYISNGKKGGQKDECYFNDGQGNLTVAPVMSATEAQNPSDGASFADINNDGYLDVVISSWYGAPDLLYLNDGKGKLIDHNNAGILPGSFAETAAFGDYNQDGWIDLYVTNSGRTKNNFLYKNRKDGTFELQKEHLLVQAQKLSRCANWVDVNGDGYTDLFVCNEENAPNELYLGKGNGQFEKWKEGAIVTSTKSSMTASWGDIDNDGDFDLFVGNAGYFSPQTNQLFRNDGDHFTELKTGPLTNSKNCTFGSGFGDYDNDGDLDLFITNGFCNTALQNVLYENQGDGSFIEATNLLPGNDTICSFGMAWGDINRDGFLDLIIANCKNGKSDTEKVNTLLMNKGNANHWLSLRLTGTRSNTSAIGAIVKVKARVNGKTFWQIREVSAQSGYAGQNSLVVHFGLGDASVVEQLVIRWPSGGEKVLEGVEVNQLLELVEE